MKPSALLLLTIALALPGIAAAKAKPAPVKDHRDVCHPAGEPGVVLCETPESYADCKAVEGKGQLLVEGDAPEATTAVKQCQQAG